MSSSYVGTKCAVRSSILEMDRKSGVVHKDLPWGISPPENNITLGVVIRKKAIRIIAKIRFRVVQGSFQEIAAVDSAVPLHFLNNFVLGRDIHMYETRGRANYRTGRHRLVVYERLPSQAGVHFLIRLPNSIKDAPTLKALRTRLKRLLVSQAFYNAGEFLAFDLETAQLED
ncbi:hypothetical protein J6590_068110 [Homalodisca vitripennis]|nr:hypothetical protein J6590_068110 [Homalodisca vitripennis]